MNGEHSSKAALQAAYVYSGVEKKLPICEILGSNTNSRFCKLEYKGLEVSCEICCEKFEKDYISMFYTVYDYSIVFATIIYKIFPWLQEK